ncbi:MAG: DUF3048 domain-containing protein [Candidatus Magasanikbacteria bacterium]|nr:DUF3048 domain-containing protein [Candidatus Magasanikbacteria bacterium]
MENNPQKNLGGEERKLGLKKLHFWVLVNLGLVFFVILLGFLSYRIFNGLKIKPQIPDFKKAEQVQNLNLVSRVIDGIKVETGKENPYPVAVMIDNSPEARPQAGLASSSYVIEAEAEGGVTRFLAIFASTDLPDRIGPVRSARPYYVDWANEFSATYTHCGGSPEALLKITRDGIVDLNEFYKGASFWRDNVRVAPHNVYTSKDLLTSFLNEKGLREGKYFGLVYKTDNDILQRPSQNEINIDYKLKGFQVSWVYNKDNNDYIRFVSGQEYKDEQGGTIRAKNVIIQTIDAKELDEKLRLEMQVIGEGKAVVCRDGKCEDGVWKKTSSTAKTRFYDKNSQEFSFNAGATWVQVVRPEINVKITN